MVLLGAPCVQALEVLETLVFPDSKDIDMRNKEVVSWPCMGPWEARFCGNGLHCMQHARPFMLQAWGMRAVQFVPALLRAPTKL